MKNFITYSLKTSVLLLLLIFGGSSLLGQQTLCLQETTQHAYAVDMEENDGEGTSGSNYTWTVVEPGFAGVIAPITSSGNQIEIDWTGTPAGVYTLLVEEFDNNSCLNQQELQVHLENCECEFPPEVEISYANLEICEGEQIALSASLTNATSVLWVSSGDGFFDDNTSLNPVYTPGVNDIANVFINIVVTTTDEITDEACEPGVDSETFEILSTQETVFAAYVDVNVCNPADIPNVEDLELFDDNGVEGSWTMLDHSDDTYSFIFIPIDENCYAEYSFTVTDNPPYPIEFEQYQDINICDEAELPNVEDLALTDDNGIPGEWILSTAGSVHTYTFMPSTFCYTSFAFTVSLFEPVASTFNFTPITEICDVEELPNIEDLPTISNEGGTGTWNVVENEEGQFIYTFVSDDSCYLDYEFTIEIIDEVEVSFADLTFTDVCDVAELPNLEDLPLISDENITGTWTQTDNGDETYTYEFTVNEDQGCFVGTSFTINILDEVEVSFVDLVFNDVCDVSELPNLEDLPTISDEDITGTWTQTDNGDETYTYTFTVDADQGCYVGTSFIVEIIENIEVTFVDLPTSNVCAFEELPEVSNLPSTSEEGVTGIWTQTDNGDETYTYTFMVDADQGCYVGTSFIVTVVDSVEITFNDLPTSDVCDVTEIPDVSTLDSQDNNGVDGTWSMNQDDDVYTYTFTPIDSCYNEFNFTVTISDSVATIFDYMDLSVCDAAEIPDISTLAPHDNNGVAGTWTVSQVDDVYTYTFTPIDSCYNEFSFTVTVSDSVDTVFTYTDSAVCDVTELPEVSTLDSQDNNGVDGTWVVAQAGDEYTYTFTPTGGCYNEFTFVVSVTSSVDTVFDYTDSSVCDAAEIPDVSTLVSQDNNDVAGTWAVNQVDDVYTYTFTPTGGCYNEFVFTVTVTDSVDTEFDYTDSSVCDVADLPLVDDLDSQDNNDVDGTWTVTQTGDDYTYTFTPTGGCYNEFSFTVSVSDSVDTVFDYTDSSVCDVAELPELGDLAIQDNNSVEGTWTVVQTGDDNAYTFTPSGGCYNEFSFTVSVSDSVDTVFDYTDSSICDAAELPDLGDLATQDNNGVDGTWTVSQVGDVYTFTFTPIDPCYNEFSFVITVTDSVDTEFTYVDSTICDAAELPELGDLATQDNNGVAGTWTVSQVGDVYTYIFTATDTCYNEFSFVVTVTDSVDTVFTYVDSTICDVADLPIVDDLDSQDNNGVAGTWSVSQIDDVYTYTFMPSGDCYNEFSFIVTISGSVDTVFTYVDSTICDVADLPIVDDLDSQDNNGVDGTWTVSQVGDVYTYTFTPTEDCYNEFTFTVTITDSVDTEFTYVDLSICDAAELPALEDLVTEDNNGVNGTWSMNQVDDVYTYTFTPTGGCYNEFTFVVIITSSVDTVFNYTDSSVCDAAEIPDVSTLDSQDNNGVEGTWTVVQTGDDNAYTFTPSGGCYNEFTFVVSVTSSVNTAFNYTDSSVCDIAELPLLDDLATQDDNGVDGTWSVEQVDDVYTYTFTPTDTCYNEFTFTVTISDSVATIFDYTDSAVCDTTDLPEVGELALQDNNGVDGAWSVSQDADVYTYTFTPSGDCYNEFTFTVTVTYSVATIFDYTDLSVCDVTEIPEISTLAIQDNNGVDGTWAVIQTGDDYTYTFTPTGGCFNEFSFTVTVSDSVDTVFTYTDSAVCDAAELPEVSTLDPQDNNGVAGTWTVSQVDDVYTYTFTPTDSCYNEFSFDINIVDAQEVSFNNLPTSSVCDRGDLPHITDLPRTSIEGATGTWTQTNNGNQTYTYEFTLDENQGCYIGISFTVQITDSITPEFSFEHTYCQNSSPSSLPQTSDNGITGQWLPAVINTAFTNMRLYTFVPHEGQCASSVDVMIEIIDCLDEDTELNIPNVITPNNDGMNDTWFVDGLIESYPNAELEIYNRYNKLLYQGIGAENCEWNGTYAGRSLPSGNYWYVLKLADGKVKTGHITIIYP